MIYVTGDTHGTHDIIKLQSNSFGELNKLTKDDYVIICGDFGGIWQNPEEVHKLYPDLSADDPYLYMMIRDNHTLDFHEKQPYTTLWLDGNHENFDVIEKYPITEWNGGKVQFIRDHVIHLMRGQVYTIDGIKLFVMGGATSIDKIYRKEHISWWSQEIPSLAECDEALKNLDKHNWKVDYVLTHSAPDNILYRINPTFSHDIITNFLFSLEKNLDYKHWYFGHYHVDENFGDKHTALYNKIIKIGDEL